MIHRTGTRPSTDVLDDFSKQPPITKNHSHVAPTSKLATTATAPPASVPATSPGPPEASDLEFTEEFARQMEAMLRDLTTPQVPSSSAGSAGASDATAGGGAERDKAFRSAWENMLVQSMDGGLSDLADGNEEAAESEDVFQRNVEKAMERLRRSDTSLQENASAPQGDEMANLLASLGGDEPLQTLLEEMMGQLMGKEVLYEPLKELNDKFPSYLASNADKLSASDLARYRAQHACASKIVAVFEDPRYKDEDPKMATEIVTLMSEMQEHGAPPAEIMGELPPGLELGPDGAPKLPEGCVVA
ncbi:Pex19 protein [Multifurca ochricompacta]|uniref:Pex19 protein n=1 Tax=Multifurca ochricompacta TaxID=376703 RepID=A0AAD4QKN3_9AGAM|nr:Pex19 protein [Multifurca ochricompacta]